MVCYGTPMSWPTTSNPKQVFVTVRFPADEAAELDAAFTAANMTKSAFIRQSVRRVIAADKKQAARLKGTE